MSAPPEPPHGPESVPVTAATQSSGGHPPRRRVPPPVRVAGAILLLLAALAAIVAVSALVNRNDPASRPTEVAYRDVQAIVMGVFTVVYLVLGLQVWRGRRWAQVTAIVLLGVTGLLALGNATTEPSSLLSAAIALLVILLLTAPSSARAYFDDPRRHSFPPPPQWRP